VDDITVAAARTGDRPAQERLLRWLQDPWYRLSLSLLGDVERAREATQETAARFLRQLSQFRGESQVRTWALGIAINVAREMRRSPRAATGVTEWDELAISPAKAGRVRARRPTSPLNWPSSATGCGRCSKTCRSGSGKPSSCGSSRNCPSSRPPLRCSVRPGR
jgi:hypothetical protein